ncbi:MAG: TerB family tellurite resistance protein [Gemmatimonadetes bacterium]|nr:TerB family tellurite resistance protein [Gemmatimonadota bacterium]
MRWRVQRTVLRNVFEVPVSILTRTLGLLNLFAIVPQNLFAVVWRGSQEHQLKCLSIWLYDEGKEVDDVVIGEDGSRGSDRALVLRLAYLLRNAAAADGEISAEEVRRAVAAIGSFTEGRCTPELAHALLTEGVDEAPPLVGFDFGRRIALLRAVLDVMAADDELTDDERHFVATVGDDRPPTGVRRLVARTATAPRGAGHASPDGTLDPDVLTSPA